MYMLICALLYNTWQMALLLCKRRLNKFLKILTVKIVILPTNEIALRKYMGSEYFILAIGNYSDVFSG